MALGWYFFFPPRVEKVRFVLCIHFLVINIGKLQLESDAPYLNLLKMNRQHGQQPRQPLTNKTHAIGLFLSQKNTLFLGGVFFFFFFCEFLAYGENARPHVQKSILKWRMETKLRIQNVLTFFFLVINDVSRAERVARETTHLSGTVGELVMTMREGAGSCMWLGPTLLV